MKKALDATNRISADLLSRAGDTMTGCRAQSATSSMQARASSMQTRNGEIVFDGMTNGGIPAIGQRDWRAIRRMQGKQIDPVR